MTVMTSEEIKKHLPHRYPFLLVDRVCAIKVNESITAYKNVSFNEPYFNGHFPSRPVMPGVLIIEAMAQASGILILHSLGETSDESGLYFLAGVDNARFKRVVEPGDQLMLEVEVIKVRKTLWKFQGRAMVGDQLACEATFINIKGN